MAAGSTYPADIIDGNGFVSKGASIQFLDSTNQPQVGSNPIVSGTLPNSGSWVSGTAKANPTTRQITMYVECVGDATNNAASCTIALAPNGTSGTFTTIATPALAAAVNNTGAVTLDVAVVIPAGWAIKLTFSHFTVAASVYF
jgi:hypothetical protein